MKIDFIHIGYHRTASTMLQVHGFPLHHEIQMLNSPQTFLDEYFVTNFVEIDDLEFNANNFMNNFEIRVFDILGKPKYNMICGISEENISGHFWNGSGNKLLAERVKEVFGNVKVIIFVRNQLDLIASLYGNYIKNSGGTKSIKGLINDDSMVGNRVFSKLCYHRLIEHYVSLFSKENVLVLCYEDFNNGTVKTLNKVFSFVGASKIRRREDLFATRVNARLSIVGEYFARWMNFFELNHTKLRRILFKIDTIFKAIGCPTNTFIVRKAISETKLNQWRSSNRKLQAYVASRLTDFDYPY